MRFDTYVKENYPLSRKHFIVFTQAGSDPAVPVNPEFVFKGKKTRAVLNPPLAIKFQWTPKRSYLLEHKLKTIQNLPNNYNIIGQKLFYVLSR